jgi:very-short-patch-repair endonuclease
VNPCDVEIARLAAKQHGLVSRPQAIATGLTTRQVQARVTAGLLVAVHRGVYRMAGAPPTPSQVLLAACFAGGEGAVASHRSAAAIWRLRGVERPQCPEITVHGTSSVHVRAVVVHRTSRLRSPDVGMRDGIPATSVPRTLLDLGAVAPWLVEAAMEDALFRGLTTPGSLRRVLDRVGASGRNGTAVLSALAEARTPGQAPTESPLEDAIVGVLRRHGLPEPVRQHRVRTSGGRTLRLDLAYPDIKLAIEADGRIWHSGRADFARDRARTNVLAGLGWTLLRFGWHDVGGGGLRLAADVSRLRQARLSARAS